MEFIQVPETPAPEPLEPDVPDCCGEEKIGESDRITYHPIILSSYPWRKLRVLYLDRWIDQSYIYPEGN